MIIANARNASLIILAFALPAFSAALAAQSKRTTVQEIAPTALRVSTPAGAALLPIYVSTDWSKPQPQATRALVIFHGKSRNAAGYFRSAKEAVQAAGDAGRGTLVIAPQ